MNYIDPVRRFGYDDAVDLRRAGATGQRATRRDEGAANGLNPLIQREKRRLVGAPPDRRAFGHAAGADLTVRRAAGVR